MGTQIKDARRRAAAAAVIALVLTAVRLSDENRCDDPAHARLKEVLLSDYREPLVLALAG